MQNVDAFKEPSQGAMTFAPPSEALPEVLPEQIKALPRWLLWRAEPFADDATRKPRKVPYYATGERRQGPLDSPEDIARLSTFETAWSIYNGAPDRWAGIGFAVTGEGIAAFDLDACLDDAGDLIAGTAAEEIAQEATNAGLYAETSPSRRGLRIFGESTILEPLKDAATGVEYYAKGRFLTVTGRVRFNPGGWGSLRPIRARLKRPDASNGASGPAPEDAGQYVHPATVRDLRSALLFLRSDDRGLWIRMGHALKTLGETGRGLWLEWSSTSEKFDPADASRTWETLRPTSTSHEAVFAEAQRQGWTNPGKSYREEMRPDAGERQPFFEPIGGLISNPKPIDWLVKNYLEKGSVSVLLGEPGRGKTYLALSWACAVATGSDWAGQRVQQAPVLLIAGEGQQAVIRRAVAWHTIHGGLDDAPLNISRGAVSLNSDAFEAVMAEILEMPEPPGLVIIDTLARCLDGDENAPEPMGGFVKAMDRLRDETGATVLALHHPGKADPRDPRGHSSLRGAIDSLFLLEARQDGVALINTKQRGGQPSKAKFFRFRQAELPEGWRDPEAPNEPVYDAIVEACSPLENPEDDDQTKGLKDAQRQALAILQRLEAEYQRNLAADGRDPEAARVVLKDWRDACKEGEIAVKHFSRIRRSLQDRELIGFDGLFAWTLPKTPNTPNGANGDAHNSPNTPNAFRHGGFGEWVGSITNDEEKVAEEMQA